MAERCQFTPHLLVTMAGGLDLIHTAPISPSVTLLSFSLSWPQVAVSCYKAAGVQIRLGKECAKGMQERVSGKASGCRAERSGQAQAGARWEQRRAKGKQQNGQHNRGRPHTESGWQRYVGGLTGRGDAAGAHGVAREAGRHTS